MLKLSRDPFSAKWYKAKDFLELVHIDICGPVNIQTRGGYEYFVAFTDDNSKYGSAYLMQ